MFDELSARFEDAVKGLRGQDKISDTNVEGALKDVRRALLEADVSLPVVKAFVADVREKAVGSEVVRGVSPDQKFIQVVHEQLVEVMGGGNAPLARAETAPTVVLMAGLQGAGKTTATAKLGLHLKDQGRRALMVGADVYRPAAIEQLKTLGGQIGVEVFSLGADAKPEAIAAAGLAKAKEEGFDTLLVPAETQGVELEGQWLVGPDFSLGASATYADAKEQDTGRRLPYAPEWSASLNALYERPWSNNALVWRLAAALNYRDEQYMQAGERNLDDALTLLDLRLALASADVGWEIALMGRNLLDEVSSFGFDFPFFGGTEVLPTGAATFGSLNRPRTIALQARYDF